MFKKSMIRAPPCFGIHSGKQKPVVRFRPLDYKFQQDTKYCPELKIFNLERLIATGSIKNYIMRKELEPAMPLGMTKKPGVLLSSSVFSQRKQQ